MLTVLDVVLLVMFAIAAWRGWRVGASASVLRIASLGIGLVGGLLLAEHLLSPRLAPLTHLGLALACVLGAVLIVSAVGSRLGDGVAAAVRRVHLGVVDRAAGAVLSVGISVVVIWIVAAVLAAMTITGLPQVVADSAVIRGIDSTLPATRTVTEDLQRSGRGVIPADVLALLPVSAAPSTTAGDAEIDATAQTRGRSVVKVMTAGCGSHTEGTGFVTAYEGVDFVITNAHVVAGADSVTVTDSHGTDAAQVMVFDAAADLAVLRAPDLAAPALPLTAGAVPNGTSATILGYPRDRALTQTGAVIVQRTPTVTSTASGPAVRETYRLRAEVEHGNSGSPLLTADGRVAGVVNAISLTQRDTGFALTADAVRTELGRTTGTPGASTGDCVS